MLYFAGAQDAVISHSAVANYAHPEHPGLDDFGEAAIVMDNAATGYCRVDWFTPDGLSTWGMDERSSWAPRDSWSSASM